MALDSELASQFADVGVQIPTILLPGSGVDLQQWAVVACDQHTSEPDYWHQVENLVADAPSTLRLVFPEVYLDQPDADERITAIHQSMDRYLADGHLVEHPDTAVLVRRIDSVGATRWGLLLALDLDHYDWHRGSRSLMRATEGTIEDRLPPRVAVRRGAALEVPHIMVLISDATRKVIEPLATSANTFTQLYDTPLMLGGGHVTGWAVPASQLPTVAAGLTALRDALDPDNPLLFAMGDGNHSFATAKSYWDSIAPDLTPAQRQTHPARFALVEVSNIYDEGLAFEPIHRVLFGLAKAVFDAELTALGVSFTATPCDNLDAAQAQLADQTSGQRFVVVTGEGVWLYQVTQSPASLAAGTVQRVVNALVDAPAAEVSVDYIHGDAVAARLGAEPGNLAVLLPAVSKDSFFASIVADGALPRKTFSLGHAADKRYYLEARAIR